MELINAGNVSMMLCAVPEYSGSMNRRSVDRYLRLSFASLTASVVEMSICFQRLSRPVVRSLDGSFDPLV